MVDADKKVFWSMINITMELCNRPALSKEAIVGYWQILNKYDIDTVRTALDTWVDSNSKSPTPHDLKDLCKPITPIYAAIARRSDKEANRQHAKEVVDFVANNLKPQTDHKAWARRIISNPKNYPDISFKLATEALKASA